MGSFAARVLSRSPVCRAPQVTRHMADQSGAALGAALGCVREWPHSPCMECLRAGRRAHSALLDSTWLEVYADGGAGWLAAAADWVCVCVGGGGGG